MAGRRVLLGREKRDSAKWILPYAIELTESETMMCYCGHGSDRHFLDYAGPGVLGGVLGKCLEDGCACTALRTTGIAVTFGPFAVWPFPGPHNGFPRKYEFIWPARV